jgi:hypothetical protein
MFNLGDGIKFIAILMPIKYFEKMKNSLKTFTSRKDLHFE